MSKSPEKTTTVISVDQQDDISSINDGTAKLEKRFSLWTTCALQYSLICSPLAIGTFLSTVVGVGGSPVLIYGFILSSTMGLIICCSLAELASAYPHSSAQVYWTYCLAPKAYKRVMSFTAGILSCAGWVFACVSSTYVASMFVVSLAQMYNPDYVPKTWHYYLVYAAVVLSGHLLNVFLVVALPLMTDFLIAIINFATLFVIITLLVKSDPKRTGVFVFKNITNETGWSSDGVVFFLGLLPSIASVCLFDGPAHMTDEIEKPERNIPLVMVISNSVSVIVALFAAIVYMFCIVNVDNLSAPLGGMPIVQLMYDSFNSKALTTVGVLCFIFTFIGSSYLYYCSTSRLIWSFAKSNGLPFGQYFGQISNKLKSPVWALTFVDGISIILGTMIMGSTTALNAVLGSAMVCVNLSYVPPIACLLYNSRFSFSPFVRFHATGDAAPAVLNESKGLPYFSLGKLGMPLNTIAVVWICFIMVWLNFPIYYPVTTDSMNYACVVLGCTLVFAIITWFAYSRKHFDHNTEIKHF
ncbi:amino acid/polyamine transporter I [Scheffersomyces xylosifermentans]|uniref:amino acid/polyamine transporter I n=1 Tax=Scheffersomyces xylosifermentans TaxID=1304137 RepID=UPI00315C7D65